VVRVQQLNVVDDATMLRRALCASAHMSIAGNVLDFMRTTVKDVAPTGYTAVLLG
jgi:hypothetical protein